MVNIMPSAPLPLYPSAARELAALGQRLKDARLRRRFAASTVCARANISRPTLYKIEHGDPAVTLGSYVQVLRVLGLEKDLSNIAKDDELGRRLQDERLPHRLRAPRRSRSPAGSDV
jgi:transcriptional regulator with XRE-family HTH domain